MQPNPTRAKLCNGSFPILLVYVLGIKMEGKSARARVLRGRPETTLLALSRKEHVNHGESRRSDGTFLHKKDDD